MSERLIHEKFDAQHDDKPGTPDMFSSSQTGPFQTYGEAATVTLQTPHYIGDDLLGKHLEGTTPHHNREPGEALTDTLPTPQRFSGVESLCADAVDRVWANLTVDQKKSVLLVTSALSHECIDDPIGNALDALHLEWLQNYPFDTTQHCQTLVQCEVCQNYGSVRHNIAMHHMCGYCGSRGFSLDFWINHMNRLARYQAREGARNSSVN